MRRGTDGGYPVPNTSYAKVARDRETGATLPLGQARSGLSRVRAGDSASHPMDGDAASNFDFGGGDDDFFEPQEHVNQDPSQEEALLFNTTAGSRNDLQTYQGNV